MNGFNLLYLIKKHGEVIDKCLNYDNLEDISFQLKGVFKLDNEIKYLKNEKLINSNYEPTWKGYAQKINIDNSLANKIDDFILKYSKRSKGSILTSLYINRLNECDRREMNNFGREADFDKLLD